MFAERLIRSHALSNRFPTPGDDRINYPELLRALYVRAGRGAQALLEAGGFQVVAKFSQTQESTRDQ